jgi:hypothetical protein
MKGKRKKFIRKERERKGKKEEKKRKGKDNKKERKMKRKVIKNAECLISYEFDTCSLFCPPVMGV